jgi:hypothetical protein
MIKNLPAVPVAIGYTIWCGLLMGLSVFSYSRAKDRPEPPLPSIRFASPELTLEVPAEPARGVTEVCIDPPAGSEIEIGLRCDSELCDGLPRVVRIPAGAASCTVAFDVRGDRVSSGVNRAVLELVDVRGASIGEVARQTVQVMPKPKPVPILLPPKKKPPPVEPLQIALVLEKSGLHRTPGENRTKLSARLSKPAPRLIQLNVSTHGNAEMGVDYDIKPDRNLTIAKGEQEASMEIFARDPSQARGDRIIEILFDQPGTDVSLSPRDFRILLNDRADQHVRLVLPKERLVRGSDARATLTARLDPASPLDHDLVLLYDITGTARYGVDFVAIPPGVHGSLAIEKGKTEATLSLLAQDKDKLEGDRQITLRFRAPAGVRYSTEHEFRILIEEPQGSSVTLDLQPATVVAGESAKLTARLTEPAVVPVVLTCKINPKAKNGNYLKQIPQSVTIERGQTQANLWLETLPITTFQGCRGVRLDFTAPGSTQVTPNFVQLQIKDEKADGEAMVLLVPTERQERYEKIAEQLRDLMAEECVSKLVGRCVFVVTPEPPDGKPASNWFPWDPRKPLDIPPERRFESRPERRDVFHAAFQAYRDLRDKVKPPGFNLKPGRLALFVVWASTDSPRSGAALHSDPEPPGTQEEWYVFWLGAGSNVNSNKWLDEIFAGEFRGIKRLRYSPYDDAGTVAKDIVGLLNMK